MGQAGAFTRPAIQHRAGQPILDPDNLDRLDRRWAYAFACRAGVELAGQAVAKGCKCFVGYDVPLQLDWDPKELPPQIQSELEHFLAAVVCSLALGEHSELDLKRRLYDLAAPIERWLIANPHSSPGLLVTITQLKDRLVVRLPQPETDP